jgi:hypothetical protein
VTWGFRALRRTPPVVHTAAAASGPTLGPGPLRAPA